MTTKTNKDFVFMPIIIWALYWFGTLVYLIPFLRENWTPDIWLYGIIIFIVERLAISIWTVELTRTYRLNSNLWVLLAFIFGANELLFINIRIWFKTLNSPT